MNRNQELVVEYLAENGVIDGLQDFENARECVPKVTQDAYEALSMHEYYDALTESIKQLKGKL